MPALLRHIRLSTDGSTVDGIGDTVGKGDFVFGPENRLLAVAVQAVLESAPDNYSPVVFYGPSGRGKSLLGSGLAAAWRRRHRASPSVICPAPEFARDLADAIETQRLDDFRLRYRRAKLVVLEDLHRLVGKPAAQRELVGMLDTLADQGAWAVLTCADAPAAIAGLLTSLVARASAGLTVPLAPLAPETRLAILRHDIASRGATWAQGAAERLAEHVGQTVGELRGALIQLETQARLEGGPVDCARVAAYLHARGSDRQPTIQQIAQDTARYFAVPLRSLRGSSRRRTIVAARHVAMYLARKLTTKSLQQIGGYFRLADHTSVSHGCRRAEALVKTDPVIREAVTAVARRCQHPGRGTSCVAGG